MTHNGHVVHEGCQIGPGTVVRDFTHLVRCTIGRDCKIGTFVEIQADVEIGDRCKIEPFAFIPSGVRIYEEAFIGPHVCFTNDTYPRATGDWELTPTVVCAGASIGANATILPGVTIGQDAMVAAGSIVTKDVPHGRLYAGCPARDIGPAPKLGVL